MTRIPAVLPLQFIVVLLLGIMLPGCSNSPSKPKSDPTLQRIKEELTQAAQSSKPEAPEAVKNALLPPLKIEMPKASSQVLEPRFDLVVNNAPAAQVFMGIVSGTRYSMLMSPDLSGNISVNLKDVTVLEALESIREINGYEYKVDGTRIYIQPLTVQTRVFKVNYLIGSRVGSTTIQVTGGSSGSTGTSGGSGGTGGSGSTSLATASNSDFWKELTASLNAIVGHADGRSVVVSPQSGVIVVRATPVELRSVADFLMASQLSVERQVILEAKIIEVQLSDDYQAGINWAAFGHLKNSPSNNISIGMPGSSLTNATGADLNSNASGAVIGGVPGATLRGGGGLFGLVFQTNSFAATLSFLESQGNVHVLSSPRIATLNNQKAILKVGSEDTYVTGVIGGVTLATASSTSTTATTPTLQQLFSGIVLDVTPQIDEKNSIILHIHPSVTRVSESTKVINVGGAAGTMSLPVASTVVSETDSIVRAQDGQIVAIGGLMKQSSTGSLDQTPGIKDIPIIGEAFRQTKRSTTKAELVILLKATIVHDSSDWAQDMLSIQRRVQMMGQ